jgi:hypothetical protein
MNGKFRIWDGYHNEYIDEYNIEDYFISSEGFIGRVFDYDFIVYTENMMDSVVESYIVEYSTGHNDSNDQEWYVGDWTILDDYCIGILAYDDEMSCFGFNTHSGVDINNYDRDILVFEPLYYYNVNDMTIEGDIHDY